MSFDVFLQCFQNGEPAGIPRELVRAAFGAHLTETETDFWQLRYDDANSCDLYLTVHGADQSLLEGLTVNRPCSDLRLWNALAAILALGEVVLYFPEGRSPLVARSSVTGHLPPDLIEELGLPVVVTSGREIQQEIQAA